MMQLKQRTRKKKKTEIKNRAQKSSFELNQCSSLVINKLVEIYKRSFIHEQKNEDLQQGSTKTQLFHGTKLVLLIFTSFHENWKRLC